MTVEDTPATDVLADVYERQGRTADARREVALAKRLKP